ncbi:MFS general substrate transporter [Jaminaea rosea]|uniref:MFS general substrate transporter n=1 Tax=Jaminaea rosea TaxID=1569628 RepID=A0A316V019_9BASI|nr:MFS general substrate transporter [Jaminaea rosea]PWN28775.1 MFS general substrate transporter [Jaminaea rosea]
MDSTYQGAGDKDDRIILVQFDEGDKENPMNWSKPKKWLMTSLLCSMTLAIGLSTTAYSSGIGTMVAEFGVSNELGQLGLFMFNASCAIAPLFFAPFCELTGRRVVYVTAFGLFSVFTLMLVFGENIATILLGRFFQGVTGSIGTILVGGTLADLFDDDERSIPTSIFTFSAIVSTVGAPLYANYIDQYLGWRWIQRVMICFTGAVFILEAVLFRETRGSAILTTRAKKLRKDTGDMRFRSPAEVENQGIAQLFRESSLRAVTLLIREPVVSLFGAYLALAWGVIFLFLSVINITFGDIHGWSEGNVGLAYIPLILGCFIGFGTGLFQDHLYFRKKAENKGVAVPEARLYGAMIFSPLFAIGMFIFAWTGYRADISYWGPLVGLCLILVGIYHVFLAVYSYTGDAYQELGSSAIAGQGLMRNMFAAVTPLFATQMFNGMGVQWAGTLLAILALILAFLPFILFAKGETIRAKSKYASSQTGLSDKRAQSGDEEKAGGKAEEGKAASEASQ